jgi:hypothetical protein
MNKEKQAQAQEILEAKLQEIASSNGSTVEMAKLANMPYDAELPVPQEIMEVALTDSVAVGEDYDYFAISPDGKVVTTISNGSLTNLNVTPDSEAALTFYSYSSDVYNVYLEKILAAKYDAILQQTNKANESLNRKEVGDLVRALFTAAEARSNTYALTSGETKIGRENVRAMVRSLAKYGNKLVMISGGNVTTDLLDLDYDENKQREVTLEKLGINKWLKLEALEYTHSTTKKVLDENYALVVATSDADAQKCIHFIRRKTKSIDGSGEKERVVVVAGPMVSIDTAQKWAYKVGMMEQYGIVVTNTYVVAAFYNAASYVNYSA